MATSFDRIALLSEQELLDHFTRLVVRDRSTTAELLVAIAEIDERKVWASHACSSMFTFCMQRFHMSEQVTAKRLWAARTARRFPIVLDMVERGELHLGAIHLLAKHLTADNHARVLERARHKSSREVERLVAELAPRADVPSRIRALPELREPGAVIDGRASVAKAEARTNANQLAGSSLGAADREVGGGPSNRCAPAEREIFSSASDGRSSETAKSASATKPIVALSPRRYKIEITVDEATQDKLRSLQDLLARSETGRDPAAIISRAIDVLLVRTLARKAACTDHPKPAAPAKPARADLNSATSGKQTRTDQPMPATPAKQTRTDQPMPATSAKQTRTDGPTTAASDTMAASDAMAADRTQRSRSIPAAVRREVWTRDAGRCGYVDGCGRRCRETSHIDFHHRIPFAMGGLPTPENIELRCAAHNQYQADLDFGRSFMDARRRKGTAARTFPGECSSMAPCP